MTVNHDYGYIVMVAWQISGHFCYGYIVITSELAIVMVDRHGSISIKTQI